MARPWIESAVETYLEGGLFASRWLLAPFYVGLVFALAMLLVVFVRDLIEAVPYILHVDAEQIILSAQRDAERLGGKGGAA